MAAIVIAGGGAAFELFGAGPSPAANGTAVHLPLPLSSLPSLPPEGTKLVHKLTTPITKVIKKLPLPGPLRKDGLSLANGAAAGLGLDAGGL
jgi:hypothetical protein